MTREVIRCRGCRLNQFVPKSGFCRKCRVALRAELVKVEPVRISVWKPPAPIEAKGRFRWDVALKLTREGLELSQRQLGILVGVPRTYVSKIETGNVDPTWQSLVRLCERAGISFAGLLMIASAHDKELFKAVAA